MVTWVGCIGKCIAQCVERNGYGRHYQHGEEQLIPLLGHQHDLTAFVDKVAKGAFASKDAGNPAKFYFNSLTAHRNYPDKKVTKADAVVAHMGSLEGSNDRNINKMLVNQVLPTCQLQMGMTELLPGSVWNTMPAHVHSRRMEAYFYFEVPEDQAVCHFMGEVDETRHIWMKGDQAVLSPEWSIHSAAATHNYTFIWGMGGENLDYGDQDFSKITDLK